MRSRLLALLFVPIPFLVGCGDDGGTRLVDAKVFLDAPPPMIDAPAVCTVEANLMNLQLGQMGMAVMGNWFYTPTMGPNANKKTFIIAAGLPGGTMTVIDAMVIEVVRPANGFVTGQPTNFNADPNSAFAAASYILGEFDRNAMTYQQPYWAQNGAATFTAIGEADGNAITGSVSATMYAEIDDMSGALIPGGCTSALGGLSFTLTQMMMFDGPQFSPREMKAMAEAIERFKLTRQE